MRLLFRLLLTAVVAFAAGAWLLVRENPEAEFWAELRGRQDQELAELRSARPAEPVLLFAGGSSCAFSVDPGIITAGTGMGAVNFGTSAWSGPKYYVAEVFRRANPGDRVVLGIESNFLTEPGLMEPTPLGLALAWGEGDPDAAVGGPFFGDSLGIREHAGLLRPGARFLVTWLAKRIAGGERYYYSMADLRPGGRLETRRGHPGGKGDPEIHPGSLTPEAKDFLEAVARRSRESGVGMVYTLPWYFTAPESAEANREARRQLLTEIAAIMPVLDDPMLGVCTEPGWFADTNFHLTATGSEKRSRFLAGALASWLESGE
ncbi:hypothetical protein [Luteolibacter marinus]|uniref:hypothetical protein n=1 Tax=Luteolibacter marinus TaxID=2776705 RepID=UPI001865B12D|nr:hypothetical protein [Luteolibacter marinus]